MIDHTFSLSLILLEHNQFVFPFHNSDFKSSKSCILTEYTVQIFLLLYNFFSFIIYTLIFPCVSASSHYLRILHQHPHKKFSQGDFASQFTLLSLYCFLFITHTLQLQHIQQHSSNSSVSHQVLPIPLPSHLVLFSLFVFYISCTTLYLF